MDDPQLENLIQKVQANPKYRPINRLLIQRLSEDAIAMGLTGKSALKYVRNKCHQIGGAYFMRNPDYQAIQNALSMLPHEIKSEEVKPFCLKTMGMHASTAERLLILSSFFETCLAQITPITSLGSVLWLESPRNPLDAPRTELHLLCLRYL